MYIAFLDNYWKKCDEVALDDTAAGATGRGGAAGERPIGMPDDRGVVGKHPIGMPGVARSKHGACAQIGVGEKLQRSGGMIIRNLYNQLPHRS